MNDYAWKLTEKLELDIIKLHKKLVAILKLRLLGKNFQASSTEIKYLNISMSHIMTF